MDSNKSRRAGGAGGRLSMSCVKVGAAAAAAAASSSEGASVGGGGGRYYPLSFCWIRCFLSSPLRRTVERKSWRQEGRPRGLVDFIHLKFPVGKNKLQYSHNQKMRLSSQCMHPIPLQMIPIHADWSLSSSSRNTLAALTFIVGLSSVRPHTSCWVHKLK